MQNYKSKNIERSHHWMVKALDTVEEARILISSGQTRLGAYNRLYYAVHHASVSLLRLVGNNAKKHTTIRQLFGREWVVRRKFPKSYGKLLKTLSNERTKADYGEYVPTLESDLMKRLTKVMAFIKRAQKEIPPISIERILKILISENAEIKDFSFDIYCPKSYYHHTRFTIWSPRGRINNKWLKTLRNNAINLLKLLKIEEYKDYVIGLNSRVNQYNEKQFVMLDFDNVSTIPLEKIKNEPAFLFRTVSGFHFIGSKLYDKSEWKKHMKMCSKNSSKDHYELSMKRVYSTLRITTSARKPYQPIYIGRVK